jgi:HAD superfamily hydrolase (TIGR01549 family)
MITTFLFDLDDTLIDSKIYKEIYPVIVEKVCFDLKINQEELFSKAESFGLKKNKYGNFDSGDLCRKLNLLELYYSVLEEAIKVKEMLHDNVLEVFSSLKEKGKTIGIVSNSMLKTIKLYLNKYEIKPDFIFSSDYTGCLKDCNEYWKKLITAEQLTPSECLVIGDDYNEDVTIPSSLGFKTFYLDKVSKLKEVEKFIN